MNRLIISFVFVLFTLTISAQNSIDGFMKIFGWVEKLDNNISSIVKTENQKKLSRQLGYLQSDLDNFINEKRSVTSKLIAYCENSSVPMSAIKTNVEDYNYEILILIDRLEKIRKSISFNDELYTVTEKKKITVYRKPDSTQISPQPYEEQAMIQQSLANMPPPGFVAKDTIINKTVTKNKIEWKEVDFDTFLFEIKTSLNTKSENMNYIVEELSKGCNLKLIGEESEMAVTVLSNIKNEIKKLRSKVIHFQPE
ncbi:MAG: hypothetical protein HQ522_02340 [Bacteroidetes bacterium]|nr:hypothetical protein [Bacteroidota bacterium]